MIVSFILLCSCANGVSLSKYREVGKWNTFENEQIKIRIPENWCVKLDSTCKNEEVSTWLHKLLTGGEGKQQWVYSLFDENADKIFKINVVEGGSEFIYCLCASKSDYDYSKVDKYKVWSIYSKGKKGRTIKVANELYRLDIHLHYSSKYDSFLDYIAESARPVK